MLVWPSRDGARAGGPHLGEAAVLSASVFGDGGANPSVGPRAEAGVSAVPVGQVQLFAEDGGLRGLLGNLPPRHALSARSVLGASWLLRRGPWSPEGNPPLNASVANLLVLDGLLLTRVKVGSRWSAEFLGPGDLFRPDQPDTSGYDTVPSERSWRVLAPSRIVVLERELMLRIDSIPGAAGRLQARWAARARSLAVRLAIAQIPRLTTRIHVVLWHLADRWGRIGADGVVIPFRVTQQTLAECVCAQRSSVAASLHELSEDGRLARNEAGHWVLRSGPPPEFA